MNNFKKTSAILLAFCTAATIFTSCNKNETNNNTSTTLQAVEDTGFVVEKETIKVKVTDKQGNVSVSVSEKIITVPVTKTVNTNTNDITDNKITPTTKHSVISQVSSFTNKPVPPLSMQKPSDQNKTVATTPKAESIKTTAKPVKTTKRPVIDDIINEKAVGIYMLSKSDPVQTGNQASIIIEGTPGKTYSIEFYESPSSVAKSSELDDTKADSNGFVSWTFEISNNCNRGKRKILIKEKNSSNYLETSITVK